MHGTSRSQGFAFSVLCSFAALRSALAVRPKRDQLAPRLATGFGANSPALGGSPDSTYTSFSCSSAGKCPFRNPKIWGPPTWFFLHAVTLSQDQEIALAQGGRLRRFFTQELSWLLPCPPCARHYRAHIATLQPMSDSVWRNRSEIVEWLVGVHNRVNHDLGKPGLNGQQVVAHYAQIFQRGPPVSVYFKPEEKTDYDAQANDPSIFRSPQLSGPPTWFFMHAIALSQEKNISSEQQVRLRRFFTEDLSWLLACNSCGKNLRAHLAKMEIPRDTWATREGLAQWVGLLHNLVNKALAKPELPWSEAKARYTETFERGPPADVYLGNPPPSSGSVRLRYVPGLFGLVLLLTLR